MREALSWLIAAFVIYLVFLFAAGNDNDNKCRSLGYDSSRIHWNLSGECLGSASR